MKKCEDCEATWKVVESWKKEAELNAENCILAITAIKQLCNSMVPHPHNHPSMYKAKQTGLKTLKELGFSVDGLDSDRELNKEKLHGL